MIKIHAQTNTCTTKANNRSIELVNIVFMSVVSKLPVVVAARCIGQVSWGHTIPHTRTHVCTKTYDPTIASGSETCCASIATALLACGQGVHISDISWKRDAYTFPDTDSYLSLHHDVLSEKFVNETNPYNNNAQEQLFKPSSRITVNSFKHGEHRATSAYFSRSQILRSTNHLESHCNQRSGLIPARAGLRPTGLPDGSRFGSPRVM